MIEPILDQHVDPADSLLDYTIRHLVTSTQKLHDACSGRDFEFDKNQAFSLHSPPKEKE